jgi:pimeloyl-ACP methyl ester carboxylesterase
MNKKIVLLHGWGKNAPNNLKIFEKELQKLGFKTLLLKLPGFAPPEPKLVWGVPEYGLWVERKIQEAKFKDYILFGHSFGGQIAVWLSARMKPGPRGLVLCASAAIRPKLNWKKKILSIASTVKKSAFGKAKIFQPFLRILMPESDYYQATDKMKAILSKVVKEDMSMKLPLINTKSLILWGEKDKTVDISLGRKTAQLLPSSKFYSFASGTHSLPYSHPAEIAELIDSYFYDK